MFPHKKSLSTHYYYLAMAEDIILRLLWVIGLILKQVTLTKTMATSPPFDDNDDKCFEAK